MARPFIGEGSSPAITLANPISFFEETVRIAYVSTLYASVHSKTSLKELPELRKPLK